MRSLRQCYQEQALVCRTHDQESRQAQGVRAWMSTPGWLSE